MRAFKFQAWYQGKMYEVIGLFFNSEGVVTCGIRSSADSVHYMSCDQVKLRQFTGLLDKHGQEVYEGDLVKSRVYPPRGGPIVESIDVVEIAETGLLSPFYVPVGYECETWTQEIIDGFEVIGNRYEHPELLEGGAS